MSDNLRWLTDDKTILVLTVPEYWEWREMLHWLCEIEQVLDTCDQQTAVMFDFQYSTFLPKHVALKVPPVFEKLHPLADPIIFVRLSPTHRAVLNLLTRIHRNLATVINILEDVDEIMNDVSSG